MNKGAIVVYLILGLIVGGFVGFGLGQWISPPAPDYYGGGQIGGPLGCLAGLIVGFFFGLSRKFQ